MMQSVLTMLAALFEVWVLPVLSMLALVVLALMV